MTNGEKLKEVFPNTIFIKEMSPEGKMIGLYMKKNISRLEMRT